MSPVFVSVVTQTISPSASNLGEKAEPSSMARLSPRGANGVAVIFNSRLARFLARSLASWIFAKAM